MVSRLVVVTIVFLSLLYSADSAEASALSFIPTVTGPSNPFNESSCPDGDAGDSVSTPCVVTGGPYDGFAGEIGFDGGFIAPTVVPDFTDVFAFAWLTDGDFTATYYGTVPVFMYLFYYPLTGPPLSSDTDPDDGVMINVSNLLAGNYMLEIDALVDPPFSIGILGPTPNPIGGIQQVPEPATLVLIGGGVAVAAVRRRRQQT